MEPTLSGGSGAQALVVAIPELQSACSVTPKQQELEHTTHSHANGLHPSSDVVTRSDALVPSSVRSLLVVRPGAPSSFLLLGLCNGVWASLSHKRLPRRLKCTLVLEGAR